MTSIEIRVVANGYWVAPAYCIRPEMMTDGSQVHVFETFEGLTKWMQENLAKVEAAK